MSLNCKKLFVAPDTRSSEKHGQLFLASCQLFLQVTSFNDGLITRWTTLGFEESVDTKDIANVAIVT